MGGTFWLIATQTFLASEKKSRLRNPPSLPMPLSLVPPNGVRKSRWSHVFTHTSSFRVPGSVYLQQREQNADKDKKQFPAEYHSHVEPSTDAQASLEVVSPYLNSSLSSLTCKQRPGMPVDLDIKQLTQGRGAPMQRDRSLLHLLFPRPQPRP